MTLGLRPSVSARAPGKLFLMGEYAVLYGAPAIVQAVDRYVTVTVSPGSSSSNDIQVICLGADLEPLHARFDDSFIVDTTDPGHELVATILEALAACEILTPAIGAVRCTIDSRALFFGHNKLGLGSSAAITHALTRALVDFVRQSSTAPSVSSDFVFNVHRAFQHGRGSGADIGAGVMGGTYMFRRASEHTLPDMTKAVLPDGLKMVPVWAGRPASTSQALSTLSDFQTHNPAAFSSALTPLMSLAEEGAAALRRGRAEAFIDVCDRYGHNLSEFGRTVGVDIMSDSHRRLRDLAAGFGVVYKPSGAGNGDIGIGYSLDEASLEDFMKAADQAGYSKLELAPGRACHRI